MNLSELMIKIGIDSSKVTAGFAAIKAQVASLGSSVANGIKSALSSVWGVTALVATGFTLLGKGIQDFADKEKAIAHLKATLSSLGDTTAAAVGKIKKLADELELFYDVDDSEYIKAAEKIALVTGATGETLEKLTRIAAGLSVAFDVDLATAVDMLDKSLAGNYRWMKQYGIIMKETATDADKLGMVLVMSNVGIMKQSEAAKTAAGKIAELRTSWSNALEDMGNAVLTILGYFEQFGLFISKYLLFYDSWKMPDKKMPWNTTSSDINDLAGRKTTDEEAQKLLEEQEKRDKERIKERDKQIETSTQAIKDQNKGLEDQQNRALTNEDKKRGQLAALETDRKRKLQELGQQINDAALNSDMDAVNQLNDLRIQYEKQFAADRQKIEDDYNKQVFEDKKKLAEEVRDLQHEILRNQIKEALDAQEELLNEQIKTGGDIFGPGKDNIGKSLLASTISGSGISGAGLHSGVFQGVGSVAGETIGKSQLRTLEQQLKIMKDQLTELKKLQGGLG